jgi:hypothetical protein
VRPPAHDPNASVAACLPTAFRDRLERVPYSWSVNAFGVDDGTLVAVGWALPIGGDPEMTEFLVDDEPARPVERNGIPMLRERYPYWPNASESGFVLRVPKGTWTQRAVTGVELSIRHRASRLDLDAYARWHLPIRGAKQPRCPPTSSGHASDTYSADCAERAGARRAESDGRQAVAGPLAPRGHRLDVAQYRPGWRFSGKTSITGTRTIL